MNPNSRHITSQEFQQLIESAKESNGLMCVTEWDRYDKRTRRQRASKVLIVKKRFGTETWECQEHDICLNLWTTRCWPV